MADSGTGQPTVRALLRGLDVLRHLNDEAGLSAAELASRCDLARITVYRLLRTLEKEGYVRQGAKSRYFLGPKVLSLNSAYSRHNWLSAIAVPAMQSTSRELGWPLALATNNGPHMSVQHTTMDETGFWLKLKGPGSQLPLLRTAMGLAYLAHAPKRIAGPLIRAALALDEPSLAEHSRHPEKIEQCLTSARATGIANVRNAGESEHVSLSAIGVPVGRGPTPIAAIALVYYSASMAGTEAARRFGPDLQRLAKRISDQI